SSRRRHTRSKRDWSSDVCSSDLIVRRGKVYYAKFARGKAMFLAPRMIPYFHAVWGMRRSEEKRRLSRNARAILNVLRKEWEMSKIGRASCRERVRIGVRAG